MDCTVNHRHNHLRSPCLCPQSVELGVPWLPVGFQSAINSRNTYYLDCYPIVSQTDGSHLSLCLCWQTRLFPKCWFWWITVSRYLSQVSAESWSNRENFFFWLRTDQVSPGLSLPVSSTPLHFSVPDGTPDCQHDHRYQIGQVTVFVLLFSWTIGVLSQRCEEFVI